MLYSIEEVKKVLPEGIKLQIVGGKISGFSIYSSRKFKKSMSCAKYNIPVIWMELISLLEDQSSEELERLKIIYLRLTNLCYIALQLHEVKKIKLHEKKIKEK